MREISKISLRCTPPNLMKLKGGPLTTSLINLMRPKIDQPEFFLQLPLIRYLIKLCTIKSTVKIWTKEGVAVKVLSLIRSSESPRVSWAVVLEIHMYSARIHYLSFNNVLTRKDNKFIRYSEISCLHKRRESTESLGLSLIPRQI